jgi:hypothetical protein
MKIFHCDHCGQLLFFENTECGNCGHRVAYLPDVRRVASLDPDGDEKWRSPLPKQAHRAYRLCRNDKIEGICNWAVSAKDVNPLCGSCRITKVIPNLAEPAHRSAWYRLEVAKRRLLFTLVALGLMGHRRSDPEQRLTFEFLADTDPDTAPVLTGHHRGVITINVAEADDVEREKRRAAMHEPYRTLLGHMRHESGHYYWDRLIKETKELEQFRSLFGDEQADYAAALRTHYENGAPADWHVRFVSAYASSHPWEDWAETWAHYLHMVDTLETAAACGLSLRPRRSGDPLLPETPHPLSPRPAAFERLIGSWFPLTYLLNNLNRGLGLADAYPFVLSSATIIKLRFVHDVVCRAKVGGRNRRARPRKDSRGDTAEQALAPSPK